MQSITFSGGQAPADNAGPAAVRPARRRWLHAAGRSSLTAAAVARSAPWPVAALSTPLPIAALSAPSRPLFSLGVASGFPGQHGVTLWTRLAAEPERPDGGMGNRAVAVHWEVCSDPAMRHVVRSGDTLAEPAGLHSVHVDVDGLAADRVYWYRFQAAGDVSPTGRTRTLPEPDAAGVGRGQPLRIIVTSCQNIEHGWYAAHRHIAGEAPDLVLHVGDYIYEETWGKDLVRPHGLPTARTLDDYRARYTLYRRDPDLQAAHATAPWFVLQDDHEVANDYAGLIPPHPRDQPGFAARRAAAWRAWYEHMPVPRRLAPAGNQLPRPDVVRIGDLVSLYLLDTRQFRAPQACPPAGRAGGNHVDPSRCDALYDPTRSLLGLAQEAWLDQAFAMATARWNVIAQQTLMAPLRTPASNGRSDRVRTDGWDGYPAARSRLTGSIAARRLANPVVVGGDLHAHYVADLRSGIAHTGPIVATEFVGTSITSQAGAASYYARMLAANRDLRFADGSRRGYLRLAITPARLQVDMLGLEDVRRPDSGLLTQASWVVEAGQPGAHRAG